MLGFNKKEILHISTLGVVSAGELTNECSQQCRGCLERKIGASSASALDPHVSKMFYNRYSSVGKKLGKIATKTPINSVLFHF